MESEVIEDWGCLLVSFLVDEDSYVYSNVDNESSS